MALFNDNELIELSESVEKEITHSQNQEREKELQNEKNGQVLRKTFNLFMEAVKEFPKVATAIGLSPSVIDIHVQHKTLFGTKYKLEKKALYYVCSIRSNDDNSWYNTLAIDIEGNIIRLKKYNNIEPINEDSLFSFIFGSKYFGIGDTIESWGLSVDIYLFSYETEMSDTSTTIYHKLVSLREDEQIRKEIKDKIAKIAIDQKKNGYKSDF